MAAVARLAHDPFRRLAVGIGQAAELAQRQEAALYVFDTRFDDPLLSSHQLLTVMTVKRRITLK
jgi:hypothetical protein